MEADPIKNDARKAARHRRLGKDAACILCGETNPEALLRAPRSLLEEHHVAGRVNDDALKVPLCRNCHAKVTEGQRDAGVDLKDRDDRTILEQVAGALISIGVFLLALGKKLMEWGELLADFIRSLDLALPGWRDLPESKR